MSRTVVCMTSCLGCPRTKNVVIIICRSGRRRSVANAVLWSNTLTHYSRHQHSVSLLHLSELGFWKNTCAGKCSEQSSRICQTHYDRVRAECSRIPSVSDSVTDIDWKRPRLENCSGSCAGNMSLKARSAENSLDERDHFLQASKKRATGTTTMLHESNTNRGSLDALVERLGNFHERTRALLAKKDQSMIDAAKCMFHI